MQQQCPEISSNSSHQNATVAVRHCKMHHTSWKLSVTACWHWSGTAETVSHIAEPTRGLKQTFGLCYPLNWLNSKLLTMKVTWHWSFGSGWDTSKIIIFAIPSSCNCKHGNSVCTSQFSSLWLIHKDSLSLSTNLWQDMACYIILLYIK